MLRALWTAATGMRAQQLHIDVIANNLANVDTVGFKRTRVDFQDLIYQTLRPPGADSTTTTKIPTGIQVGLGVKPAALEKIFLQGNFKQTGNPLDIAIEGKGFFRIQLPNGDVAYTRAGAFKMDDQGRIVTSDGYPLDPIITIPQDAIDISIGEDGTVSVLQPGATTYTQVGQIVLVDFANPAGLRAIGKNLFKETDTSGAPIEGVPGQNQFGTLAQGYIEASNVDVVEEMVNLIIAQRAYEANSRAIQTGDEMLRVANELKR
ncbi:MAG: flagellar basal-body rod protein FlgG [Thermosulfidibacteraceae bacterium]|jgi:flagellar basal-body rod protein FlgG